MKFSWKSLGMAVGTLALVLNTALSATPAAAATTYPKGTYDAQTIDQTGAVTYRDSTTTLPVWGALSDPLASWETLVNSFSVGNSATFQFTGSTIGYLHSMSPNHGTYAIYVDGILKATRSAYAPEVRRSVIDTVEVLYGTHTVEVRHVSGPMIDFDAFAVDQDIVPNGYEYDNTNTLLRTLGTWTADNAATGAFNTTQVFSNQTGAVARLGFRGTSVTLKYTGAYNRGKAAVTIDGITVATINQYEPGVNRQRTLTFTVPSSAQAASSVHNLHITVLGQTTCSGQATCGTYIDIDSITVHP